MMNPHQAGSGGAPEKKGKFYHAWELEKQAAAAAEADRRKLMQRRRKAMGGKTDDEDEDDGSGLPEGWPTPAAADVATLLAMEMPSLKLPKHRPGDVTYHQQQQLNLDMAEIPDEGGWSGLARPQVRSCRGDG